MDPAPDDGVAELLEILRRAEENDGKRGDAGNRIQSLPRTSSDFESSRLRSILHGRLEVELGAMVNAVLCSDDLKLNATDGAEPNAVDQAVAGLTGSPSFVGVVDKARAAIARAAPAPAADLNGVAPGTAGGSFFRRNLDALSSSDTEREDMHVKKKAARRNDWVDIFDRSGGLGGGMGFSPRVDVEAAMAQLEAGLASPGGSPASAVEALGSLAEADPELFQFGNHWKPFLKLARQALGSADPVVHSKAMTLHWVMYEKSMGMCAADMCEGVLAHARGYFSKTVHVLSAAPTHQRHTGGSAKSGDTADIGVNNLMIVGDSKLSCAAREARALHGMLVTIHETFQHLPERRVWSIVRSFLSLIGDAVASSDGWDGAPADHKQIGGDSFSDPDRPPATSEWGEAASAVLLLPAHFLAIAGRVEEWLPHWLRSVPTGQLVRAINDARLVGEMARRCKLRGRIPFSQRNSCAKPPRTDPAVTSTDAIPGSGVHVSPPLEARQPEATLCWHRLSASAGSSGTLCSLGSAAPLGRALWLSAAELERSLLLQSVSFLGILATHCRGALNPCPPPADGGDDDLPGEENKGEGSETGAGFGLAQGEAVLHALVQGACGRESDGARSPVRTAALGYVGKLARATAGGTATPFTPLTIDALFLPLGCEQWSVGSLDGSAGKTNGGDRIRGPPADPPRAFLGALAEIAGVLLSSRGASAGFFVEGPEGPQASPALLGLVRCTAELAKRACWHGSLASGTDKNETGREGSAGREGTGGKSEGRFRSLGQEDSEALAVDFACALATVMRRRPKERAAGREALWRCGFPHALAKLVAHLSRPGTDEPKRAGNPGLASYQNGHTVKTRGGSGAACHHNSAKAKQHNELRDRLLLSLIDWARDLEGVICLRRVGLAGPCGAFLARELGRRHLNVSTRDGCPDRRPLALAMRIALCPEGLDSLLSTDGDVATGVQSGLARLGGLISLPELLESHAVGLPPPHALVARNIGGGRGTAAGEPAAGEVPLRSGGLELGGDVEDLRCLDFVGRMSLAGRACFSPDTAGPGIAQMRRWLRWALARSVLSERGDRIDAGNVGTNEAEEEEEGFVPQDVRVAALQLATNLAADLTTAVTIEAEFSATETLALRLAHGETASACVEDHADLGGVVAGSAASEEGIGPGKPCINGGGGGGAQIGIEGIVRVPDIVEPAALARARLAVMLTCLGGPHEERSKLMRKLRDAEASAGRVTVGSGVIKDLAPSAHPVSGNYETRERVELPREDIPDEDWWGVAARCVPQVVSWLSDPRSVGRTEAFMLLRKAAARRSTLLPQGAAQRPAEHAAVGCTFPIGNEERRNPDVEGDLTHSRQAVMSKLCFSYARSLGFVDDSCLERFDSGLRGTLAGAAGLAARSASPSPAAAIRTAIPPQADCDWFASVAFIASGADSEQASALLRDLYRHTPRAFFLLPLAGQRYAAQEAAREPTNKASILGYSPTEDTSTFSEGARGRAHGTTDVPERGLASVPSEPGDDAVSAKLSGGDPPMVLLLALVEEVLEEELPLLSAALMSAGWAPAALAERWMRQCMLCVVDWPGVVAYLAVALLRGHDYQVYFVVALFRAAQPGVLEAASRGLDLTALLGRGEALESFDLGESLSFMEGLETRHRKRCLAATRAYLAR